MQGEFKWKDWRLPYVLRSHARAKGVSIRLGTQGELVVIKPKRWRSSLVVAHLEQQGEQIVQKLAFWREEREKKQNSHRYPPYALAKEHARLFLEQRLCQLNDRYGFVYKKVRVCNQKTRWGSCSKRGTISVNYRVAHLPTDLADYVLVHELCHLKEMNHSRAFWDLVAQRIPEYLERRRQLKMYALI